MPNEPDLNFYAASCFGKVGHASYSAAQKHINQSRKKRSRGNRRPIEVYLCKFCQKYHIGHG